jgi:hypothetical protein
MTLIYATYHVIMKSNTIALMMYMLYVLDYVYAYKSSIYTNMYFIVWKVSLMDVVMFVIL